MGGSPNHKECMASLPVSHIKSWALTESMMPCSTLSGKQGVGHEEEKPIVDNRNAFSSNNVRASKRRLHPYFPADKAKRKSSINSILAPSDRTSLSMPCCSQ